MNNYTQNITFANASKNPTYMKVLNDLAIHGPSTRSLSVRRVWDCDLNEKSHGWNCGPYTLLRQNGYVKYSPRTHLWFITAEGKKFLKRNGL